MPKCRTPGCDNEVDFYNDRCDKCYDELGDLIEEHPIGCAPLRIMVDKPVRINTRRPERMLGGDLNKQPLIHVNATPDNEYSLRILTAFRENCNCRYSSSTDGNEDGLTPFLKEMNKLQEERAKILDKAIAILSREMKNDKI